MRANEKFSGRGHAKHLCKDCARLGKEELAYRQSVRNLERLLSRYGLIPRRRHEQFNRYLNHENPRIRAYALEIEMFDAWSRAEQRLCRDLEALLEDVAADEDVGLVALGLPVESGLVEPEGTPF